MKVLSDFLSKYCSEEWCEFGVSFCEKVTIKSGDSIFKIGDEVKGLFFIEKGKVKITTNNDSDSERIIRLASDGDIFGHRGFGGTWIYTISAFALEKTELVFIPIKIFNYLVKTNPEFAYFMMIFFAEELRESEALASQLPIKNVIASVLYNNYKVFGFEQGSNTKLSYTLSRKDIASQAGTRYETVVRVLNELNKEKIINIEGKSIHILNIDLLEKVKNGN